MEILGIALGGALGSVLRYGTQLGFKAWLGLSFPIGTLAVNLLGSFLIGLCAAAVERGWPGLRPWVMTGFLGGFTTFSAFSLENLQFLQEGKLFSAAVNAGIGVFGGLALAYVGYAWLRYLSG